MPTKDELLTQAQAASDPQEAEKLYREILGEQYRKQDRTTRLSMLRSITN